MRLNERSISKVSLTNVLKRRKSNLQKFLEETGIVTFELLKTRCDSMGVIPPEEAEFLEALGINSASEPRSVSSPAEGLIVLDPPEIVKESTGSAVEIPQEDETATVASEEKTQESTFVKKKKKKTEPTPTQDKN